MITADEILTTEPYFALNKVYKNQRTSQEEKKQSSEVRY